MFPHPGTSGHSPSSRSRSPNAPPPASLDPPDLLFLWRVAAPAGAPETHLSAGTDFARLYATRVSSITISELHESLLSERFKELSGDLSELPGMGISDFGTWEDINAFIVRAAKRVVATRPTSGIVILGKLKLKSKNSPN